MENNLKKSFIELKNFDKNNESAKRILFEVENNKGSSLKEVDPKESSQIFVNDVFNIATSNQSTSNKIDNKSIALKEKEIILTYEQKIILNTAPSKIIINALAGTGKTKTLIEYMRKYSFIKWNYIAFNKNIVKDISDLNISNIKAYTFHGWCLKYLCKGFFHKIGEFKKEEIYDLYFKERYTFVYFNDLIASIKKFSLSIDTVLKIEDCAKINNNEKEKFTKDCLSVFNEITDKDNNIICDFDFFIKKIYLSGASNSIYLKNKKLGLVIDEAQDLNPVMLEIIKNKEYILIAGDNLQNIYSFRGSAQSFQINRFQQLSLTESFRFGGVEFITILNKVLNKINQKNKFKFNNLKTEIVYVNNESVGVQKFLIENLENNDVIISEYRRNLEKIKKILLSEKFNLFNIKSIGSSVEEIEHKKNINCEYKNIFLSTVHQAKGLGFNRVWLLDDISYIYFNIDKFIKNTQGYQGYNDQLSSFELNNFEEKINILYTALTRVKNKIFIIKNCFGDRFLLREIEENSFK